MANWMTNTVTAITEKDLNLQLINELRIANDEKGNTVDEFVIMKFEDTNDDCISFQTRNSWGMSAMEDVSKKFPDTELRYTISDPYSDHFITQIYLNGEIISEKAEGFYASLGITFD